MYFDEKYIAGNRRIRCAVNEECGWSTTSNNWNGMRLHLSSNHLSEWQKVIEEEEKMGSSKKREAEMDASKTAKQTKIDQSNRQTTVHRIFLK